MTRYALLMLGFMAGCAQQPDGSGSTEVTSVNSHASFAETQHEAIPPADPLIAGLGYLTKSQSPDGAWRSDLYATFKDGPALTPLVVMALQEAAAVGGPTMSAPQISQARWKGADYLASLVDDAGNIKGGDGDIDYPVYTAALSVIVLSHPENKQYLKARDAWLKYLLDRQLIEPLGWTPDDPAYGGWGYCRLQPRKPVPGKIAPPLIESNLSATVFALEALRAAGVNDRSRYAAALVFVRRCQNWAPPLPGPVPPGADNGFIFIYDDPVRNKAGERDPTSPFRFHSYGSTTADGLRALLLCDESDANRVNGAKGWLITHFQPNSHPGHYVTAHERNREAVYFYYAASVSNALRIAKVKQAGNMDWVKELSVEITRRQQADGSWVNPVELVRENEPLVATSNAIITLANCRRAQ